MRSHTLRWRQKAAEQQLKTTLKEISEVAWERRRRKSDSRGEREGRKSWTMVVTGEGGDGTELYRYSGLETGDARVGG